MPAAGSSRTVPFSPFQSVSPWSCFNLPGISLERITGPFRIVSVFISRHPPPSICVSAQPVTFPKKSILRMV